MKARLLLGDLNKNPVSTSITFIFIYTAEKGERKEKAGDPAAFFVRSLFFFRAYTRASRYSIIRDFTCRSLVSSSSTSSISMNSIFPYFFLLYIYSKMNWISCSFPFFGCKSFGDDDQKKKTSGGFKIKQKFIFIETWSYKKNNATWRISREVKRKRRRKMATLVTLL